MTPTAVLARADEPGSSAGTRSLPVVAAAAVLIAAQLGLRAWAAAPGYFLLDDFVFVDRAVRGPLDLAGLLTDYNGHLMPGAFLLVDALTTLTPLSWPATVGLLLLGQLAVDVALLRLLLTLFGRRPAVLLALAVYLASAITLPAFLWWAAALNQLPLQLAVVLALTAHVRYLRSGRRQDAVAAAAAVVGGLLFSEKAVLALPLLAAVTLLWFGRGRGVARLADELRRHRFGWTLHGLIGAGFTAFYLLTVPSPVRGLATAGEAAVLVGSAVRHSVLPGLVGGPWRWEDFPPTLALTDPPGWAQVLAAVAVAAVVAATMVRRRGAGRAWALLAVTVIGSCLLLAVSRAQVIGPYPLAREYRYFTETALVGALCLALATLPVLGAPQVLRERPGPLAATLRRWTAAPGLRLGLGTAVVLALAGGSVVSTAGYAHRWAANPARPFVETARAELAARPGIVLYDAPVPDGVMWSELGEQALASRVLAAVPQPVFLADGRSSPGLAILDAAGHVQFADVPATTAAPPGPEPGCGWYVRGPLVRIPLTAPTPPGRWVVRIRSLSAADNTAWVSAGDHRVPVLFPAGPQEAYLQVTGSVSAVTVEPADPERPICVGAVDVGVPRPYGAAG